MNRRLGTDRRTCRAGSRTFAPVLALSLVCGAWLPGALAAAAQVQIETPVGQVLADGERARIMEAILSQDEDMEERSVRVMSVTLDRLERKDPSDADVSDRLVANALVFDYSKGVAIRYRLDLESGELMEREVLTGRPQASPEEREEAEQLIRSDEGLAQLLGKGEVLEGGFVVDPPESLEDERSHHRFLQLQILSPDREELIRFVTVDLTAGEVVEARPPGWEGRE